MSAQTYLLVPKDGQQRLNLRTCLGQILLNRQKKKKVQFLIHFSIQS